MNSIEIKLEADNIDRFHVSVTITGLAVDKISSLRNLPEMIAEQYRRTTLMLGAPADAIDREIATILGGGPKP
ncbi:MAG: hypothetical protein LUD17_05040 [Bacteroidales bacterium]|nr:hypothetical protein [Bacteroidales bacterium]